EIGPRRHQGASDPIAFEPIEECLGTVVAREHRKTLLRSERWPGITDTGARDAGTCPGRAPGPHPLSTPAPPRPDRSGKRGRSGPWAVAQMTERQPAPRASPWRSCTGPRWRFILGRARAGMIAPFALLSPYACNDLLRIRRAQH